MASALAIAIQWIDGNHISFGSKVDILDISLTPLAVLRGVLSVLVPRRPDVYKDGRMVDRQYTISLWGRYSYSWATPIILQATKQEKPLDPNDFAELPFGIRAQTLTARFERVRGCKKLWKTLFMAHRGSIVLQMSLAIASSALSFTPQMALYGILRSLEQENGESRNYLLHSGLRVLLLGGLMFLTSVTDVWLLWVIYSRVGIPIYEQLCGVLFQTAMQGHDVKHTSAISPEVDDTPGKGIQNIINLASVDARRIADFAAFSYLIPTCVIKCGVAFTLLIGLIGWQSLLAGLAVLAVFLSGNIYIAKQFGRAQVNLMKSRDRKVAVVSEVLQGIRQIKFSASESQWQSKIIQCRDQELRALWKSYLHNIALMSAWTIGPLMLSAVSLATYSLLFGPLAASVAFTALSMFTSLEGSLAVLPEIIAEGMEAKISCDRLDVFLGRPTKITNTVPANAISFEKASVSWPTAREADSESVESARFMLKDLNFAFPTGKLSIISGRTSSGKSLLLASILGESQILTGTVYVPFLLSSEEQYHRKASLRDWIIDNAMAYVAQIPWIQNETIKSNILFGLPFYHTRYEQVLFACALDHDIKIMPDGDSTEIGANGVNLSGGQRWRVAFARALYSRAGILIIDDIFSALDMHTGRHICDNALNGPLCGGRTTIIATHHVGLVLPYADFCVHLDGGRVMRSDNIEELKSANWMDKILLDANAERVESELDNEEISSNSNISSTQKPNLKAKQFVPDEKCATGSLKLSTYTTYFGNGARWPYWLLVIGIFVAFAGLTVGRVRWLVFYRNET